MVKKAKKTTIYTQSQIKKLNEKHPLCQPQKKNFRLGNAIRPRIIKSRFVRFPRYVQIQRKKRILLRRLKCPPVIAQFLKPLDKPTTKKVIELFKKYTPETKKEKKERLKKEAENEAKESKEKDKGKKKKDGPKPSYVKCGLNHVTYLIEQKRAKIVLIAADVDPIETVVFLPTLCKSMGVPYAIVPSKSKLGELVHKKTATCVALTEFKESANELNNLCKTFSEQFKGFNPHDWRKPEKGFKAKKREEKLQSALNNEK
jgi:large subunit ribosomal protein L7Ae